MKGNENSFVFIKVVMNKYIPIGIILVALSISSNAEQQTTSEITQWQNQVHADISLSKGNTDSTLLRLGVKTEKKNNQKEYEGSLHYTYGEESNMANEDELIGKFSFKNIYSEKSFFGIALDARRDTFADIDYRFFVNITYGHYWINHAKTTFFTELGGGITFEQISDEQSTHLDGLFKQNFEHQFNEQVKFYQEFSFVPRIDSLEDFRTRFEMGIHTQITETIALRVRLENRYESLPARNRKKNDLKFITGLAYQF